MKPPERVVIGKEEYRTTVTNILSEGVAGGCDDGPAKVIMISCHQTNKEAWATWWHEVLHAVEAEYGLTLGHRRIKKLEYALAQVFDQLQPRRKQKTSGR